MLDVLQVFTDNTTVTRSTMGRSDLGDYSLFPRFNERDPKTLFLLLSCVIECVAEVPGWSDSSCKLLCIN